VLAAAGTWRIETVDYNYYNTGEYASLALDSNDYPHVSYYEYIDPYGHRLKYAHWDGTSWQIETVEYEEGWFGEAGFLYISMALDDFEYPHISYYEFGNLGNPGFKYAHWNGAEWQKETIASGGAYMSLALDGSNYPHISFLLYNNGLQYARWNGVEWWYETVDSGYLGWYTSLALDSSDYPHISHYDVGNHSLKYAQWDGSEWRIETVDSDGRVGEYTSLALDDSDYPHISYYDYSNHNLKYARWDGSEWQIETVDSDGEVGKYTSLALDDSDYPHISYYNESNNNLKYASWDGVSWQIETVNLAGSGGDYSSLALDSVGNPHISYYDGNYFNSGYLKYARWDPNSFHLLEPEKGGVVNTLTPSLDWGDSPFPGYESYTLVWGEDPDFETYNEVSDIDESEYTLSGGLEDGDRIYWRVKSIDDEEGEYWAVEMDWYFDVELGGGVDVVDFGADATDEGVLVDWRCEGGEPAGVRVLRGDVEPEAISGLMPGASARYLDRGVEPGGRYVYWLEVTEADGTLERFGPTQAVAVPEETFTLVLDAAYPSPARDAVNFAYSIPEDSHVVLTVYDLSGRRIATPVDADQAAGRQEVSWNCAEIPSGVYLYRLETSAGSRTRRLLISR
jgi:hypothetical protein